MKTQIKLEEVAMFGFSIYLFAITSFNWWIFPVLILLPDLGMIGYSINTRFGAITYNLTHHKGIAMVALVAGWHLQMPELHLMGIILFGHASMDRVFGYGLKYPDNFKHTHLGQLNQPNE